MKKALLVIGIAGSLVCCKSPKTTTTTTTTDTTTTSGSTMNQGNATDTSMNKATTDTSMQKTDSLQHRP